MVSVKPRQKRKGVDENVSLAIKLGHPGTHACASGWGCGCETSDDDEGGTSLAFEGQDYPGQKGDVCYVVVNVDN